MKQYRKIAAAAALSISSALVVANAFAQSDSNGHGKEHGQGNIMGMQGGMSDMRGGIHGGMHDGAASAMGAQQVMTRQERNALAEKMHSAKTPEERRALA